MLGIFLGSVCTISHTHIRTLKKKKKLTFLLFLLIITTTPSTFSPDNSTKIRCWVNYANFFVLKSLFFFQLILSKNSLHSRFKWNYNNVKLFQYNCTFFITQHCNINILKNFLCITYFL